jgi:hypothetical protein
MQILRLIPNITLKFENNEVLNVRTMNFKIVSELPEHPSYMCEYIQNKCGKSKEKKRISFCLQL